MDLAFALVGIPYSLGDHVPHALCHKTGQPWGPQQDPWPAFHSSRLMGPGHPLLSSHGTLFCSILCCCPQVRLSYSSTACCMLLGWRRWLSDNQGPLGATSVLEGLEIYFVAGESWGRDQPAHFLAARPKGIMGSQVCRTLSGAGDPVTCAASLESKVQASPATGLSNP